MCIILTFLIFKKIRRGEIHTRFYLTQYLQNFIISACVNKNTINVILYIPFFPD